MESSLVDPSVSSRELIRNMRTGLSSGSESLPESLAWHTWIELQRRGTPDADDLFIRTLRSLHHRRSLAGTELPRTDTLPDEHRLTDDAFLGELWRAYKKCIASNRTGPASQLLRDIEERLGGAAS